MNNNKTNIKLAQSASALGAGILGFAVGALWGAVFSKTIIYFTLAIGAIVHVAGMYVLQMKDPDKRGSFGKLLWISAWICFLALIAVFVYLQIS